MDSVEHLASPTPIRAAPVEPEPTSPVSTPLTPTLRSLTHYQYDPAFPAFLEKLHRPPGARRPRSRLRPEDYPPRDPKASPPR